MRDTTLYQNLLYAYEQAVAVAGTGNPLPAWNELTPFDQSWVDETNRKNSEEKIKLEVELKTYTSNMIKESIRVSNSSVKKASCSSGYRWHTGTLQNFTARWEIIRLL